VHAAAHVLANPDQQDRAAVHQGFVKVLRSIGVTKRHCGPLEDALTHFLKVTRSYRSGLGYSSWLHHFCQERAVAQECAGEVIAMATKQGLALWLAWGTVTRGWALATQGQAEAGIAQIRKGLAAAQATGAGLFRTHQLTQLADAYDAVGQPAAGLAVLDEALALVEETEERFGKQKSIGSRAGCCPRRKTQGFTAALPKECRMPSHPKDVFSRRLRLRCGRRGSRESCAQR
jgi:hypothetical protein